MEIDVRLEATIYLIVDRIIKEMEHGADIQQALMIVRAHAGDKLEKGENALKKYVNSTSKF